MKKLAALLALPIFASMPSAQEAVKPDSYLCIPDMATGFKFANGKWQQANFTVANRKYLLRHAKESDASWVKEREWAWTEFGETVAWAGCDKPDFDYMKCGGVMQEIQINVRTLRYQAYWLGTYLAGSEDQMSDTPSIEIGKCSPL